MIKLEIGDLIIAYKSGPHPTVSVVIGFRRGGDGYLPVEDKWAISVKLTDGFHGRRGDICSYARDRSAPEANPDTIVIRDGKVVLDN